MFFKHSLMALGFILASAASAQADIFRWDNGQLIPGTEGITPGPGVQLDHRELEFAELRNQDLTGSRFDFSNLTSARFGSSTLTNANLTGAVVTGTVFEGTTSKGFTKEQLYSTASYQAKNLQGIVLTYNDLSGWDFSGQEVTGANFRHTTPMGFTKQQLYSTASYQQKNLQGIKLSFNDLSGWDLSLQDLTNVHLGADLTNANLAGANLTNARFTVGEEGGGHPSDLTNANLAGANLTNANLKRSTLTNANLTEAVVTGAQFWDTTSRGFTKEQLYSTASYQQKNLQGIVLWSNDLTGWDFSGQNLTNADLCCSDLTNADLSFADLRGGSFGFDTSGVASLRNMIFPDATIAGVDLAAGDQLVVRNYHGDPIYGTGLIPIVVHDHMTIGDGGVLQMLFDADPWDSTISFQPGIPVTLGGTFELLFAADVDLASQVGRTFDLFNWTGVNPTGQFQIASPYAWDLTNLYTTGEVTLTAIPEPPTALLAAMTLVGLIGRVSRRAKPA